MIRPGQSNSAVSRAQRPHTGVSGKAYAGGRVLNPFYHAWRSGDPAACTVDSAYALRYLSLSPMPAAIMGAIFSRRFCLVYGRFAPAMYSAYSRFLPLERASNRSRKEVSAANRSASSGGRTSALSRTGLMTRPCLWFSMASSR